MFAVCVTFQVAPDRMEEFMPAMLENAATSLAEEPGCHHFDVLTDAARPEQVFLYELYANSAAFDLHCQSGHFLAFNAATTSMIVDKTVTTWRKVVQ